MKKYLFLRNDELKNKKDGDVMSYYQLINHYTDGNFILNNEIMPKTYEIGCWELYNGSDYDEEDEFYYDIFQYFIIDEPAAERLAEDTDEIIYYNEELDLYLLGVTHCGMSWDYVDTNYIITTDYEKYSNQK